MTPPFLDAAIAPRSGKIIKNIILFLKEEKMV